MEKLGLPQHYPLHTSPQDRLSSKPSSPFHLGGCSSHWGQKCLHPWMSRVYTFQELWVSGAWPPGTTHSEGFFICPQEFAEALWAEHRLLQPAAPVMSKHSLWRVSLCWTQMACKTKLALDLGGLTMNIPTTGLAAAPYPNATRRGEGT